MNTITIRSPDDFHVHFRQGDMLIRVASETASNFARALVMPNTDPAITNGDFVRAYRNEILNVTDNLLISCDFEPLMTFKVTPRTTAANVKSAREEGAIAGKLYPDGVTTGSEGGVRDFEALYPIFQQMSDSGLVLSIHGEHPDSFCLDREIDFLPILRQIAGDFPQLRIVLEHISTAAGISAIERLPETVGGTITYHHLVTTLDDVIGGLLHPHHFCKPVAKRPEDREALVRAVLGGSPRFFFGSDSAPHPISQKECADGCAGAYTAPILPMALLQFFEEHGEIDRFEPFISRYGAEFYGLPLNEGEMTFVRRDWKVTSGDPLPFLAGQTLRWAVQ